MLARIMGILLIVICFSFILLFKSGLNLDPHFLPSVKINQPLPEFQLPELMNAEKKVQKSNLLGRKTILNIWATWCEACLTEHPLLLYLSKQYQNNIQWIGINYRDDLTQAKQWLNKNGNPYQLILVDEAGTFAIDLGVYATPETFLINEQGIILFRQVGPLTMEVWQKEFLPRLNS